MTAALALAAAAGHELPPGDDGRLRLRDPLPAAAGRGAAARPYVVVHPAASVPARALDPDARRRPIVAGARRGGWPVVVTGRPGRR